MSIHSGSKRVLSFVGLGALFLCSGLSQMAGEWQSQEVSGTQTPTADFTPAYFEHNDDLISQFEALMNTEGCTLPCWWGLQPGISRANDIWALLWRTGFNQNLDGPFVLDTTDALIGQGVGFNFVDITRVSTVNFYVEEQRLRWIYVQLDTPRRWLSPQSDRLAIPSVLAELGDSPEVYMFTDTLHQIFLNRLTIILVYPDRGIMLLYSFDVSGDQPAPSQWPLLRICPFTDRTNYVDMWLQSPDDTETVTRFKSGFYSGHNYHPIEEILDVDAAHFAQFFIDHPDSCLETRYIG